MRRLSRFFVLLFLVSSLPAGGAAQAAESVDVIVTILEASNRGEDFNLDNDQHRDRLIELFSYSSYNQVDQEKIELTGRTPESVALEEGYSLTLTFKESQDNQVLIDALIRRGDTVHLNTAVSIFRPGVVFLGGPPFKNGALVLVLEVDR